MLPLKILSFARLFKQSPVSGSVSRLKSSSFFVRKSSTGLKNLVSKKRLSSERAFQAEKRLSFAFVENQRRKRRQELLEASSVKNISGSLGSASIMDTGKGFLGKVMNAVGFLILGWVADKIPKLIGYIDALRFRIDRVVESSKNVFGGFGDILKSVGGVVGAAVQNLMEFDFKDSNQRLKVELDGLNQNFDDMKSQFETARDDVEELITGKRPERQQPGPTQIPVEPYAPPTPTPTPPPTQTPIPYQERNPDLWTLIAISSLEDSDPQGRADVAQSIYNRQRAGVFPGGKSIRNIILAVDDKQQYQYQPVGRAVKEFRNIKDRESAITAYMVANKVSRGTATKAIDETFRALANPKLQENARKWVENRTDFVGAGYRPSRPSSTPLRRRNNRDNIFGNYVGPGSYEYGKKSKFIAAPVPPDITKTRPQPSKPQTVPSENIKNLDKIIAATKPGDGSYIRIPKVGTLVRGKNWFGFPQDKFFDPTGKEISANEFRQKFESTYKTPFPTLRTPVQPKLPLAPAKGDTGSAVSKTRAKRTPVSVPYTPFKTGTPTTIISGFGMREINGIKRMHTGLDIAVKIGTPLHAYLPGKILRKDYDSGFGYWVEWLDSVYNQTHMFGHMMALSPLPIGQKFNLGSILGYSGDTGIVTGPHLHWEIGPQGKEIDPVDWVNAHPPKDTTPNFLAPLKNKAKQVLPFLSSSNQGQQPPSMGGSGGGTSIAVIDPTDTVLNSIMDLSMAYT